MLMKRRIFNITRIILYKEAEQTSGQWFRESELVAGMMKEKCAGGKSDNHFYGNLSYLLSSLRMDCLDVHTSSIIKVIILPDAVDVWTNY